MFENPIDQKGFESLSQELREFLKKIFDRDGWPITCWTASAHGYIERYRPTKRNAWLKELDQVMDSYEATVLKQKVTHEEYRKFWGGPREGAGRPATGAMPSRTIRMTDDEYIKVKEFLKKLRASQP